MKPKIRGVHDARQALNAQIKALTASCQNYDAGETWEAMRIATAVYTVVHDASKSQKSLLTHADLKAGMRFLASGGPINPQNLLSSAPLTLTRIDPERGAVFLPTLGNTPEQPRWIGFIKWWKEEAIYSSGDNHHLLSRMNLTFALRNKEGGSHWDSQVHDESYVSISDKPKWFYVNEGTGPAPVRGEEHASMRQIGWELLETLAKVGLL